jgi:hypothetical protein
MPGSRATTVGFNLAIIPAPGATSGSAREGYIHAERAGADRYSCSVAVMKRLLVLVVMVIGCKGDKGIDNMPKGRIPGVVHDLDTIASHANAVFRDTKAFPIGTSAQLPARNGDSHIAGGCCGSKSTGGEMDNKCPVSTAWATDPVWKALSFSIDTAGLYGFKYASTDGKSFVLTAIGDADCDTKEAVFTVRGTGDKTVLELPPSGTY